ncbi:hypothetical protein SAMN05421812_105452 [Asanoa hainanensis]|uniref:Uncharacterized protein n=1 Tax=Asanoa hainanensis TaxID=560556 RepID=A0A239MHS0_9ACTN|nr:hypothetical protein [Asanoa hainanensis]SNT41773.1 hypothetical protein SAMN05421812_105452 [Asanoa hainanensis]
MREYSEDELRAAVAEYEETKKAALDERDRRLRAFRDAGWRPVDLQRVTGYSRETIRQALRPEVRHATNNSRRKAAVEPGPPADYVPYGDRKHYVVADSLDDLHGPTTGTVTLPHHLDWSGRGTYDLDKAARLASMYKTVLNEAATVDDLRSWIDGRQLVRLWPTLWLPASLRRAWEQRFRALAGTAVA